MIPLRAALFVSGLSMALASGAVAQSISGRLVDAESGDAIDNGTIEVIGAGDEVVARVVTNTAGFFQIGLAEPGSFRLRAERIGYETATTEIIRVPPGEDVEVTFRLSTEAVLLSPLTVTIAGRPWWESQRPERVWGLYERIERYGRTGFGRFLTAEDLEKFESTAAWAILTSPVGFGIRMETQSRGPINRRITIRGPFGGRCNPTYFIDGLPFRAEEWVAYSTIESLVSEGRVEGIELFSPWYVPDPFAMYGAGCVVAVWTRDAPPR